MERRRTECRTEGDFLLGRMSAGIHRIRMPIRPENRWLYPIDWPELSSLIRFERAKGRCERCRPPHLKIIDHLGDGRWFDASAVVWRDGAGARVRPPDVEELTIYRTKVVLACAHLDHNPTNNRRNNLAALCQRCHMIHDADEHSRQRWSNLHRCRAIRDLFAPALPG